MEPKGRSAKTKNGGHGATRLCQLCALICPSGKSFLLLYGLLRSARNDGLKRNASRGEIDCSRLFQNDNLSRYNGLSRANNRRKSSMVEKRLDRSRRKLIGAIVKGISAGLLFRISQSEASDKMTPQQAEYKATPNGIYSCAVCTLFEPPKYCKVVAGEVSRDGWCKAFALAD